MMKTIDDVILLNQRANQNLTRNQTSQCWVDWKKMYKETILWILQGDMIDQLRSCLLRESDAVSQRRHTRQER